MCIFGPVGKNISAFLKNCELLKPLLLHDQLNWGSLKFELNVSFVSFIENISLLFHSPSGSQTLPLPYRKSVYWFKKKKKEATGILVIN